MKQKVIAYTRVAESVRKMLQKKYDVIYFENNEYLDDYLFVQALKEVTGIIGLELNVTKELLNLTPNLKIISNVSVGFDNLDLDELTKRRIMATNTPGVLTNSVADAVLGLILSAARRIPELDTFVKAGNWKQYLKVEHFGLDVHKKTIGIIGMGNIGKAIAKRCYAGFDMNVIYYNRSRKPDVEVQFKAKYCNLDLLLEKSDFVVLMTPATPKTYKMIGAESFSKMKKTAIFINGSRGKNVDETALYHALANKQIFAAGLDVYEIEPIHPYNPLLQLNNVVTLPHIGAATIENELAMSQLAAKNLVAGLNNKLPVNLINKEVFKKLT